MRKRAAFAFFTFVILLSCSTPPKGIFPPSQNEPVQSIYIIGHGGHAGIVIRRSDIPDGLWSENHDFPDVEYLEVGWGDEDYYQSLDPHVGLTLKAAFLPTGSVLHIVGFSGSITYFFAVNEIIRIDLSNTGFNNLLSYISDSYALNAAGVSQSLGPSLYGQGRFYLSNETYHLFNNCNIWAARGLQKAGLPLVPELIITTDSLMFEVRQLGTIIQVSNSEEIR